MESSVWKVVQETLGSRHFGVGIDLGCGIGNNGLLLRDYTDRLIGVDNDPFKVQVAKFNPSYSQVILSDVRVYQPPSNTNAVFMFEVLEHIPKSDGRNVLERLSNIPFFMLTTPSKFFPLTFQDGHVTTWSEAELQQFDFKTKVVILPLWLKMYGSCIMGVREH